MKLLKLRPRPAFLSFRRKDGTARRSRPHAWAWRWLPFEYRLALLIAHHEKRGHPARAQMTEFLVALRAKIRRGEADQYP